MVRIKLLGILVGILIFLTIPVIIDWCVLNYAPSSFLIKGIMTVSETQDGLENQILTFDRRVRYPSQADANLELHKKEEGYILVYQEFRPNVFVEDQVDGSLKVPVPLPSNLDEGRYQWKVTYTMKYPYGIERVIVFYTNEFYYKKQGVDEK